jgi:hypothetical protein
MAQLLLDRSERWVVAPYHRAQQPWTPAQDQKPAMVVVDVETQEWQTIPWTELETLEPSGPDRELFVFKRRVDDDDLRISLHPFEDPARPISRVTVSASGRAAFEGRRDTWEQVQHTFYYYFGPAPGYGHQSLILLDPEHENVELQRLDWADGWPSDVAVAGVVQIPGSRDVVISVHHDTFDARPIIYDTKRQAVVGRISLADTRFGYGQSNPQFLRTRPEAWLKDYDKMQRHRLPSWEIVEARRLQPAKEPSSLFIGASCFNPSESLCAVTRPHSGDVLGIDVDSFRVTHRASTGGQPLDIVLLSDGRIFTLEWYSSDIRTARLEPWQPDEEFPSAL